jgi:hypothetical protein
MSKQQKKKTQRKTQQAHVPLPAPDKLVESSAHQNQTSDIQHQGEAKKYKPDPVEEVPRQIAAWLRNERNWLRWMPIVLSAVTVVVTGTFGWYAKRQWDATVEQNRIMERSLNIAERAYVAVENVRMDLNKGEITITIHNVGRNPAGDLRVEASAAIFGSQPRPESSGEFKSDWGHTSLYPASLKTVIVVSLQPYPTTLVEQVRTGEVKLFVSIKTDYLDGFQNAPSQHFFYRYIPPPYDVWLNAPINTFEELQKIK